MQAKRLMGDEVGFYSLSGNLPAKPKVHLSLLTQALKPLHTLDTCIYILTVRPFKSNVIHKREINPT